MKRKLVELTQEQCQEVIEKMAERSFYKSSTGKVHNAEESQIEDSLESSIDDILPEPLPSVAKQAQTEAVPSVAEVTDEAPPTNVAEEQPPTPPIQRRVSSKQRKLSLEEYRNTFMRPYKIEDRKRLSVIAISKHALPLNKRTISANYVEWQTISISLLAKYIGKA